MRARIAAGMMLAVLAVTVGACSRAPVTRDESQPATSGTPPRSQGCADLPDAASLKKMLQDAPAQNGDAGGLNHGKAMWGALVNRNGELCALAVSTEDAPAVVAGQPLHRDGEGVHRQRVQHRYGAAVYRQALHARAARAFAVGTAPMGTRSIRSASERLTTRRPESARCAAGRSCLPAGSHSIEGQTRLGGLGVSGDTACADHEISKRVRQSAGLCARRSAVR